MLLTLWLFSAGPQSPRPLIGWCRREAALRLEVPAWAHLPERGETLETLTIQTEGLTLAQTAISLRDNASTRTKPTKLT